jgi:hypothetical protein
MYVFLLEKQSKRMSTKTKKKIEKKVYMRVGYVWIVIQH